ncbi:MAG TPA: 50S ribosomal protein L24 [Patescibacteria group bacterium]|nr:50S ribosomal protein L24 [Patescibacteria group bacterium]
MNLKRNDNVKIIAGKDKGKTGKIIQTFPAQDKVVVEGANMMVKNLRPQKSGEKGQKVEFAAPLHVSNVMLMCPKCGKIVRAAHKITKAADQKKTKKFRVCRKCQEVI